MMLNIENVTKRYDREILHNIDLQMKCGVYGLLGPNGAGKSTLIRIICGIESPSSGQVFYDEMPISKMGEDYRDILGYVPQKVGYYPDFTADEFMDYIAIVKGIPRKERKQRIAWALDNVNLVNVGEKKIKNFSGGMKQKLGIAQAILNRPQILILDEPTAGLDLDERMRFKQFVTEYAGSHLVIFATHIVSDIEDIGNQIIFLKEGKVRAQASPEKLLAQLKGNVWECICSRTELPMLREKFKISNTKSVDSSFEIRIVAKEKPKENAIPVEGTLQDLYLYLFGRK